MEDDRRDPSRLDCHREPPLFGTQPDARVGASGQGSRSQNVPGTHRFTGGTEVINDRPSTVHTFERGDAILIDYRTLHGGQPNMSQIVRPILYMVYARSWFFDNVNHVHRSSLDMPMETFEALPENLKPLLLRAYTQQIRARKLLNLA